MAIPEDLHRILDDCKGQLEDISTALNKLLGTVTETNIQVEGSECSVPGTQIEFDIQGQAKLKSLLAYLRRISLVADLAGATGVTSTDLYKAQDLAQWVKTAYSEVCSAPGECKPYLSAVFMRMAHSAAPCLASMVTLLADEVLQLRGKHGDPFPCDLGEYDGFDDRSVPYQPRCSICGRFWDDEHGHAQSCPRYKAGDCDIY